jgi:hypothetical protein
MTEKEVQEVLSQKREKKDTQQTASEEEQQKGPEEKRETLSSLLPSAVAKQEQDAKAYFTVNNKQNHLKIISQIQILRTAGVIQYKDTGNNTYEVQFNLP